MSQQLDCVVVGAGVVGLAIGRSLAASGREVVVLEAEPEIGMHTSSRNSEVIHAGLYYPEDSLKAQYCVSGKALLYDYCEARRIPHQRIGKLIVATNDEEAERLDAIRVKASKNGVDDLRILAAQEVRALEPAVAAKTALLSPSTGIIDSHALMVSLQGDIENHGGAVLTNSRVSVIAVDGAGFQLSLDGIEESFFCNTLVNSAGLFATELAKRIEGMPQEFIPNLQYAIGHYFAYQGKSPFRHLVYPIPVDGGLGVHATNDMAGVARFGPDVEWIDEVDYGFDESRRDAFVESIKRYFPEVDSARLTPSYTGIRPKLSGPGSKAADFLIQGETAHGVKGLVNLFGIESPGLTSSLAIGDYVAERL